VILNSTSLLAVISTNRLEFMNEDELLVDLEAFSHPPKCLRPEVMLMKPSPRPLPTPTTRLLLLRVWQPERNQAMLQVHPLFSSHILCLPAASYNCGKVSTVWMGSGAFDIVWPTATAYPILPRKTLASSVGFSRLSRISLALTEEIMANLLACIWFARILN